MTAQPTSNLQPFPRRFADGAVRAFHAYGTWLASITWGRFLLLSLALLIGMAILKSLPPFSWHYTETVEIDAPEVPRTPSPPKPPKPSKPLIHIEKGATGPGSEDRGVDIEIGAGGIRIRAAKPAASAASGAASAVPGAASAPASAPEEVHITAGERGVSIKLPPGADAEDVRDAVEEARQAILDAVEAEKDARQAAEDARQAAAELGGQPRIERRTVSYGESLPELAMLWILASAVMKATYKGRLQAEVKAAQATETAEAESLKRQVVEARMAAMQAQVEPHFLFNTLASIDHLIETDPPRASQMQKNLIALLRASMPTMRETGDGAARDLGRELAVVRPYVEILKVRMEERLDAQIDVPDGLLSAEFPSMMIQTLVENAIRHGLEPKPEGGSLRVKAEIVHGQLAVSVTDTGVGFGNAATAGTGVGLDNIRERLKLLHGAKASLTVAANPVGGTIVTITVPYRSVGHAAQGEGAKA
ncbi:histidine kinase [Ideonella sp. 4Y11]|uniref:histidine kinase n=2 Tax=Ideonella aquatica TaxID=2824119 RepID=A0A941BN27_9BURK|nr:histidine kinase [Ideonella aquatica]